MCLKPSKYNAAVKNVKYLGNTISKDGISVDKLNVEAVKFFNKQTFIGTKRVKMHLTNLNNLLMKHQYWPFPISIKIHFVHKCATIFNFLYLGAERSRCYRAKDIVVAYGGRAFRPADRNWSISKNAWLVLV